MLKSMLACGKVHISESRNRAPLESIEQAVRLSKGVVIVNKFEDAIYNRVGYTVVSKLDEKPLPDSFPLKTAVLAMVKVALDAVDLELHSGSHPRLGVVDHICFHPLAQTSMEQVVSIARSLAVDVGSELQVPAFLYGAAYEEGRTLDSIRRTLGYFKPNLSGNIWAGGLVLISLAAGFVIIYESRLLGPLLISNHKISPTNFWVALSDFAIPKRSESLKTA